MINSEFFSNFYVLKDPVSTRNFRGNILTDIGEFGSVLRNENKVDHLDIEYLQGGNDPGRLFWNRLLEPFCLSQSLIDLLTENNITGWTGIPVTVKNKPGNLTADKYFAISIYGRIDAVDYSKSDIVLKLFPGGLVPNFKGIYFEPSSWDGSDIFMARPYEKHAGTGYVYVTKKFVDLFKRYKVTNVDFENFNDYELDCKCVPFESKERKKIIDEKIKAAIKQPKSNFSFNSVLGRLLKKKLY